ncbi:MAG: thioredoxin family protein [Bacteroidia bacterium]|jgi:thiol-disulfide isomerase/thioredoxin
MAVETLNDASFSELLKEGGSIAVKFYADWCGSCKLFSPKFRRMSEEESNVGIRFVEINAEENPESRRLAGVDNLPFIAVFKKGLCVQGLATSKEEKVLEMLKEIAE